VLPQHFVNPSRTEVVRINNNFERMLPRNLNNIKKKNSHRVRQQSEPLKHYHLGRRTLGNFSSLTPALLTIPYKGS